jgi:hypothetical protein
VNPTPVRAEEKSDAEVEAETAIALGGIGAFADLIEVVHGIDDQGLVPAQAVGLVDDHPVLDGPVDPVLERFPQRATPFAHVVKICIQEGGQVQRSLSST